MKQRNPKLSLILIIAAFVLILATVLFFAVRSRISRPAWYNDYDEAQQAALLENKDILVVFDGSSWDDVSAQLRKDILDRNSFVKSVSSKVVPVLLDIPIGEDENSFTEQQKKNLQVANLLAIPDIPAVLMMTAGNQIYGTVDYTQGATDEAVFTAEIDRLLSAGAEFKDVYEKMLSAEGPEKVRLIDTMVQSTPSDYIFQFYRLINAIPELDPANETGLVGKYRLILAYTKAVECWFNYDSEGAALVYAELGGDTSLTPEERQEAYYKAATMCYYGNLNDELKEYLQLAIDVAPYTQEAAIMQENLDAFILEEQALNNAAE